MSFDPILQDILIGVNAQVAKKEQVETYRSLQQDRRQIGHHLQEQEI